MADNPKINPSDNAEKDPDTWVSGDDPATGAQMSYIQTLSEQLNEKVDTKDLTKAKASQIIESLKQKEAKSKK